MYDKNVVRKYHDDFVSRLQAGRTEIIRNAYENVLFFIGLQWITYDGTAGNFRRVNLRPGVPRPVVNKFKSKSKKVIAMLAGIDPDISTAPGSTSEIDRLTADAAGDVIEFLAKEVGLDELRVKLATTVGLCNNAFVVAGYDPEGGSVERVSKYECPAGHSCSADVATDNSMNCEECDEPLSESSTEYDELPQGRYTADCVTPFEAWVDWTIPRQRDLPAFMWRRMRPMEWLFNHYPEMKGKVPEDSSPTDIGLVYLQNIIRLAPSVGGRFGASARYTNSIAVDDMYAKPCKEFPKGLWSRQLSTGEVLESRELPFHTGTEDEHGEAIIPVVHYGFDEVPGSLMCVGSADDLKSPQREYNRIVGSIMMHTARSANSYLFLPEGSDITTVTGIEGQVIKGQTTAAGGGKPERIEGAMYPQVYVERLKQIDAEMDEMIAIQNIGDELPRIDSGYAIQQWEEYKHKDHSPLFQRWETAYANLYRTLFYVFRNFAPDSVYYKIKGEEARWTVKQIKKADLRGGVDIDVTPGSGQPKTALQKRAMMEEGVQLGIVDIQDPAVRLEYARVFGIRNIMVGFDAQDRAIAREQEAVVAWAHQHFDCDAESPTFGQPNPGDISPEDSWPVFVDPDIDDNQLHYARHKIWCVSEEFLNLPPAVQELFRVAHFGPTALLVGMQMQSPQGPYAQEAAAQGRPQGGAQGAVAGQPGQANMNANAANAATQRGAGYAGRSERQQQRGAPGATAGGQ